MRVDQPPRPHNVPVEPDDLPEPDDLWWSWVVLAVMHRAVGDEACGFDPVTGVLHLDGTDGSWLRMQRVLGSRSTLWGRSSRARNSAPDPRRGAPDWAVTDATLDRQPSFLSWHVHGEWDASTPGEDDGAIHLLRPILTVDPRLVRVVRTGQADADTLARWVDGDRLDAAAELARSATASAQPASLGAVRSRLRDQIHQQMRESTDLDRMMIQRPPSLVQWSRVNGPGVPFEYAVMMMHNRLRACPTNPPIPDSAARTLNNVLRKLHRDEAGEDSGAWLFARVTSDGVVVGFDRAYDCWPRWYQVRHVSQGPGLEDLAWEMAQRSPQWRPAWASLLPHS